jgi:hypothetical protein
MRAFGIIAVIVVVAGFGLVVGIAQLTNQGAPNKETDKSIDVVLNGLDKVKGKRIAVEGDVKVRMAPWVVTVGSSDATQTGLVIVADERLPQTVHQTTHVVATGIASPFSLAAFRRRHPGFSGQRLEQTALVDLVGLPAVVNAHVSVTRPTG